MAIIYYAHYQRLWSSVLLWFTKKQTSLRRVILVGIVFVFLSYSFFSMQKLDKSHLSKLVAKHWNRQKSVVTRLLMGKQTQTVLFWWQSLTYTSIIKYLVFAKIVVVATSLKGSWAWCLEEQSTRDLVSDLGCCETAMCHMPLLVPWLGLLQDSAYLGIKSFLKLALAGACSMLLTSHPQTSGPSSV